MRVKTEQRSTHELVKRGTRLNKTRGSNIFCARLHMRKHWPPALKKSPPRQTAFARNAQARAVNKARSAQAVGCWAMPSVEIIFVVLEWVAAPSASTTKHARF